MGVSTAAVSAAVEAATEQADGRLEISSRGGDVLAVVHAPSPGGRAVEFAEARRELAAWPLETRDLGALASAVRRADGKPCRCGRLRPAEPIEDDAPLAVVADARRRAVFLVPWAQPEAPALTLDRLHAVLADGGVRHGIDEAALARLAQGSWRGPAQVARLDEVCLEATGAEVAKQQAAELLKVPVEEIEVTSEWTDRRRVLRRGRSRLHVRARHVPGTGSADGRVDLRWKQGELWLTVHPATGSGRAVCAPDVTEALAEFPTVRVDARALESAAGEAAGLPVKIGTYAPAVIPGVETPVAVWVTDDALAAFLVPWSGESAPVLDVQAARAALEAAGVKHGVDDSVLAWLQGAALIAPVLVARGTPPVHGEDAAIERLATPGMHRGQPLVLEDGSIDYHELGDDTAVAAETPLAVKRPVRPGRAGCSVLGRELAARAGKDVRIERLAGPGVRVTPDGLGLVSTTAGLLVRMGEKLAVTAMRAIGGDVNFKVGNISFDGSVVVHGDVKPGFRVHATGSVVVDGEVDSADIEAGGDIKVVGGIIGEGSRAKAGKSLRAGYLHSAEVEAAGPVSVEGEVWQCRLVCGDAVRVKGRIVGGSVEATSVVAETLGSSAGTPTRVEITPATNPAQTPGQPAEGPPPVVARKHVHHGVTITIRGAHLDVEEDLPASQFRSQFDHIDRAPASGR